MQAKKNASCPYCRVTIANSAVNIPLQQIIESFVTKKKSMTTKGGQGHGSSEVLRQSSTSGVTAESISGNTSVIAAMQNLTSSEQRDDAMRYMREYKNYGMRCQVLENEMQDSKLEIKDLEKRESHVTKLVLKLKDEETRISEEIKVLMSQLDGIQKDVEKYDAMQEEILADRISAMKRIDLIEMSLKGLYNNREKAKLILHNIMPNIDLDKL